MQNLLIIVCMGLFILFPKESTSGASEALMICGSSVIASIFPFMVASKMLIDSNSINVHNPIWVFIAKIFNISRYGLLAVVLGFLCGYPIGAKTVCDLTRDSKISRGEASILLAFCNNGGPGFIIGTIGISFLSNINYGIIIYISHLLGAFFVMLIFKNFNLKTNSSTIPAPKDYKLAGILTNSIRDSSLNIINVVAIITFFAAFYNLLNRTFLIGFISNALPFDNQITSALIRGFFEVTMGVKYLSVLNISLPLKLSLISFIMSLSGVSIYCQVLTFVSDLRIKLTPYLIGKVLSAIFSLVICYFYVLIKY